MAATRPRVGFRDLTSGRWHAVLARIEGDLSTNLSIEELAATAGISTSCFARLFKQRTGLTPCNYIIQQRIERVKQLVLKDNGLSLADIAVEVGFADQAHLTRHFKRLTGMTPAQFYRQSHAHNARDGRYKPATTGGMTEDKASKHIDRSRGGDKE